LKYRTIQLWQASSMNCHLCGHEHTVSFSTLADNHWPTNIRRRSNSTVRNSSLSRFTFACDAKNVQLGTIVSRERMFEDYYYLSSVNAGLVRHFESLAKKLAKSNFVVDIGSNDGILLRPLKAAGIRAIGVEPSVNVQKSQMTMGSRLFARFSTPRWPPKLRESSASRTL